MFFFIKLVSVIISFIVIGCNSNMTDEEKREMWSKAQTTQEIIDRSGTKFNSGVNQELALSDAQNRLMSGGGLLGNKPISLDMLTSSSGGEKNQGNYASVSMNVNQYLWRASLETISFMPIASSDALGGTIITDWYSSNQNPKERCKLNIFIKGTELKTRNLKVTSFCQIFEDQIWINSKNNAQNDIKLENAILNNAKKLKTQTN